MGIETCARHPYLSTSLGLLGGIGAHYLLTRARIGSWRSRLAISASIPMAAIALSQWAAAKVRQQLEAQAAERRAKLTAFVDGLNAGRQDGKTLLFRFAHRTKDFGYPVRLEHCIQWRVNADATVLTAQVTIPHTSIEDIPLSIDVESLFSDNGDIPFAAFTTSLVQRLKSRPQVRIQRLIHWECGLNADIAGVVEEVKQIPMSAAHSSQLESLISSLEAYLNEQTDENFAAVARARIEYYAPEGTLFEGVFDPGNTSSSVSWTSPHGVSRQITLNQAILYSAERFRSQCGWHI